MFEKHDPVSSYPSDVFRHYLADIIYGANDGIVTTFTVISGVEGAKLTTAIIIILGFVNLFADGFSMGASRFLSIRAGASVHGKDRGFLEPLYHALCTLVSFVIFGLLPLLSFLISENNHHQLFVVSCVVTAIALFITGSLRVFVTKKHWLRGGVEMLLIGGIAAAVAYYVGFFVKSLI